MPTDPTTLWKITARFPSHCGSPAHVNEYIYIAELIEEAIQLHKAKYSHGTIESCTRIGEVTR